MDLNKMITYGTTLGSIALGWVGGIGRVVETAFLETIELCIDGDSYDVEVGDELDLENIFPPIVDRISKYYIGAVDREGNKQNVIKRYNVVLSTEDRVWYSFVGKVPIKISVGSRSKPSAGQGAVERVALIQFPRGCLKTKDIWKLLLEHKPRAETQKGLCKQCFGNQDFSEIVYPVLPNLKEIILCTHGKKQSKWVWNKEVEDLLEEVRRFLKAEEWHKEKNIPWRFGILLYGTPGNGKSEFIRALQEEHGLDLCGLASEKDTLQKDSQGNLFVIEDYDSIYNGRENKSLSKKGDFADLLKIIDKHEGLVVITTNKLEVIDKALGIPEKGRSSRPGRLHRVLEMGNPTEDVKQQLAKKIFPQNKDFSKILNEAINDTYAQFIDRCAKEALEDFWNNKSTG
jgi:hypothetical protein